MFTNGETPVGWTEHIGVMLGLVEGQIKLWAWKDRLMQDPTRLVEAYQASVLGQDNWLGAQQGARRFFDQRFEQYRLPPKQLHLVLVNGTIIPCAVA